MLLKDAFRYQKFLTSLYNKTRSCLMDTAYTTFATEEHLRHKANPDAKYEKIPVVHEKQVDVTANQLIDFACHLYDERRTLTHAIAEAKRTYADICDFDAELENNRIARDFLEVLKDLGALKGSETTQTAYDTKFNVNGDQIRYAYEVKRVVAINYDRNRVKRIAKALALTADTISEVLDRAKVECNVNYAPKYDVNDSFEDVILEYLVIK